MTSAPMASRIGQRAGRQPRRQATHLSLASTLALVLTAPAQAAEPPATLPLSVMGGFETLRLPGHEALGLASASVLFEAQPGVWLGPVVFGAATGQRGGLFVLGGELQRRWALRPGLELNTGLALGGGGGAGAPVGDGLLLRPAATLMQDLGPVRAGISWSSVRFAGTGIRSQQLGLVIEWRGDFVHWPLRQVGERVAAEHRSGLGLDNIDITAAHYRLGRNRQRLGVNLAGARLEQSLDSQGTRWGVEAAAATQSANAGYMEILGTLGRDWPLGGGLRAGLRGAAGLGGGGAVPAGGGMMARLDGTLAATLAPGWRLGASLGRLQGRSAGLRGEHAELWLSADLEPADLPGTPGRGGTLSRTEWGASLQQLSRVARKDGSRRALQTLGLTLNRWLSANLYLSGQAHSAYGGGAGAYSVGLLGGGLATAARPDGGWQLGVEALVGGAGGGGVASVSGAIGQAQLWVGYAPAGSDSAWRLGLGGAGSLRGGSPSPLASLTWSRAFGQAGR